MESINYHLELTPAQLKITHTALRSLLDDFGHDERQIGAIINEVIAKLPDEHAIRAIQLDVELEPSIAGPRAPTTRPRAPPPETSLSLSVADRPAAGAGDGVRVRARVPLQGARCRRVAARGDAPAGAHLARALPLARLHARHRHRDGRLGSARGRALAGADLARPVRGRRRTGAAHGHRRPALRPRGHPSRVARCGAGGARARLPRRHARGRRQRLALRLRDLPPGHLPGDRLPRRGDRRDRGNRRGARGRDARRRCGPLLGRLGHLDQGAVGRDRRRRLDDDRLQPAGRR